MRNDRLIASGSLAFLLASGCVLKEETPNPTPEDPGIVVVGLNIINMDEGVASGADELHLSVARVDAVIRPLQLSGPNVGTLAEETSVITVSPLPFSTVLSLSEIAYPVPMYMGEWIIPPGELIQLRYVIEDAQILTAGELKELRIPSGHQTGIKFQRADGAPIEVVDQETTSWVATVDGTEHIQLLQTGHGFQLKPVVELKPADTQIRTQFSNDRLFVLYDSSATSDDIAFLEQQTGAVVLPTGTSSVHTLQFPEATVPELLEKLEWFRNSPICRAATLDYRAQGRGSVSPNDPILPSQYNLMQIDAEIAWQRTIGHREIVVAVVDCGFDIQHPDIVNNLWVNAGELPQGDHVDCSGRGPYDFVIEWDFDQDGVFTLHDVNWAIEHDPGELLTNQMNLYNVTGIDFRPDLDVEAGDPASDGLAYGGRDLEIAFRNGCDDIDPLHVVDDFLGATVTGSPFGQFENARGGVEPIGATGVPIIPNPYEQPPENGKHGLSVASIVGAEGDNNRNISGVAQNVRLMLVNVDAGTACHSLLEVDIYNGIQYAVAHGADVINLSASIDLSNPSSPEDDLAIANAFLEESFIGAGPLPLLVVAAGNSMFDLDREEELSLFSEATLDRKLVVAAMDENLPTGVKGDSNYGASTVDMAAPGGLLLPALLFGSHQDEEWESFAGSSAAAPHVAGTAALLLSQHHVGGTSWCSALDLKAAILNGSHHKTSLINMTSDARFLNADEPFDNIVCTWDEGQ